MPTSTWIQVQLQQEEGESKKHVFFLRLQSQDLYVFEVLLQGSKEKAEADCDLNKAKELGTCDQRLEWCIYTSP